MGMNWYIHNTRSRLTVYDWRFSVRHQTRSVASTWTIRHLTCCHCSHSLTQDRFKNRSKSFGTDDDWVSIRVDNSHDLFWERPEYFFDAMQSKRRLRMRTSENALKLKWLSPANWPAFCWNTCNEPIEHLQSCNITAGNRSIGVYL